MSSSHDDVLLTSVRLALPAALQAIPHILCLVDDLLKPKTIDSAVYLELDRVKRVHGASRPWTVGAMDGAAARGKLNIVHWLHNNRCEGCSSRALNGAAANNHLATALWLWKVYGNQCNVVEAIEIAAANGQLRLVKFLRVQLGEDDISPALAAAAANGHIAVVEFLMFRGARTSLRSGFAAAAANGQVEVLKFMLARGCDGIYYTNRALKVAAGAGQIGALTMMLDYCDKTGVAEGLAGAAGCGQAAVVVFLLERVPSVSVGSALESAADNDHWEIAKLLLDVCISRSTNDNNSADLSTFRIQKFLLSAVERGRAEGIRLLHGLCGCGIVEVFGEVASRNQLDLMEVLLDVCENSLYYTIGVNAGLKEAVSSRDVQMVKMLVDKCSDYVVDGVLKKAAASGCVEMVEALAHRSTSYSLQRALISAMKNKQDKIVEVLLVTCDQMAIAGAIKEAALFAEPKMMERLLERNASIKNGCGYAVGCACEIAVKSGRVEMTKVLVEKSDLYDRQSALTTAVAENQPKMVEILLEHVDHIDDAFQAAAVAGDARMIDLLLEKQQGSPQNLLERAITLGLVESVEALLQRKTTCTSVASALERAIVLGRCELIQLLLKHIGSARINEILVEASIHGYGEVVKLVYTRVDPCFVAEAIDAAERNGHVDIVCILQKNKRPRIKY